MSLALFRQATRNSRRGALWLRRGEALHSEIHLQTARQSHFREPLRRVIGDDFTHHGVAFDLQNMFFLARIDAQNHKIYISPVHDFAGFGAHKQGLNAEKSAWMGPIASFQPPHL